MRTLSFLLFCFCWLACNDDDAAPGPAVDFDPQTQVWLSSYPDTETSYTYRRAASSETAEVRVVARTGVSERRASCERGGEPARCAFENALLRFEAEGQPAMYAGIWLFAEDRISLVAADQVDQLVPEIARYRENSALFSDLEPEHFSTLPITGYLNPDNSITTAFRVVNTDSTGLQALPPLAFTLVRERGIVEWTDRAGTVWMLE